MALLKSTFVRRICILGIFARMIYNRVPLVYTTVSEPAFSRLQSAVTEAWNEKHLREMTYYL